MSLSVIVLIVLFILTVAVLLLLHYLRHLRRRCSQLLPHSAITAVQLHHLNSRRQISPAPSSSGLFLPSFKFSDVKRPGSVNFTGECAICLSEFEPDQRLRLLPLCLQAFHGDCIDTWLAGESQIFPVCRAEVFRSYSDLLWRPASVFGSFRLAIGNVRRGRRPENAAGSSARTHSIRGGEFEYIVEEDWELELIDAVVPVHEDMPSPPCTAPMLERENSYGVIFTGSSRRWICRRQWRWLPGGSPVEVKR